MVAFAHYRSGPDGFHIHVQTYCSQILQVYSGATGAHIGPKDIPVRGWVIVIFMMCLGMALKIIGVPVAFTASFYSGLGPALLTAAILFLKK